jgi:inosine-uridine nucleoside N-ribohydrolase
MKNNLAFLMTLFLILTFSAGKFSVSTSRLTNQDEIKVIVDMDAAPDDWSSILYLLTHPGVTVLGIGVSCGVSYVHTGVTNTLGILEHLGIVDIPVAAGKETPLVVDHAFPTPWRDASYNFYGLDLPETSLQPSSLNASELTISLIEGSEENITIVSLGPLTNIAIALESEPTIKSKISKILLMGGAIDVPGNVGLESDIPNYVAEWNIWVDPHAADIVFKSGLPITMVPLDATNQVPQTHEFLDRLEGVMTTPEALLLYNMTTPGLYFWDQLTVVTLINPEVVTFVTLCINIVIDLENHEGQTNSTNINCSNALVAMSANALLFEDLFIGYINDDLSSTTITSTTPTTPTTSTTPPTTTATIFLLDPLVLTLVVSGLVVLVVIVFMMKRR